MTLPGPYDVVSFDLGDTLVRRSYDFFRDGIEGLPADSLEALRRWRASPPPGGGERDLATFLAALGVPEAERVAGRVVARETAGMEAYPDALATLRELDRRGYRLIVVSNVSTPGESYARRMLKLDLLPWFFDAVFSHDVGVRKPDPRIFRLALERAGAVPARAVHVGDLVTRDVRGARAAGLAAVWLDRGPSAADADAPPGDGEDRPDAVARELADLLEILPARAGREP